jgi:hypothetical protein
MRWPGYRHRSFILAASAGIALADSARPAIALCETGASAIGVRAITDYKIADTGVTKNLSSRVRRCG